MSNWPSYYTWNFKWRKVQSGASRRVCVSHPA